MSSKVVNRVQCPQCQDTGNDNLVMYADGGGKCFACDYVKPKDFTTEPTVQNQVHAKPTALSANGYFKDIDNRGISKRTCEYFMYQCGKFTGYLQNEYVKDEPVHIANYLDEYGSIVAQKIRNKDKKFTIRGDASKMGLYGQWKYPPNPNVFVTVVEGEIDALTVAEIQGIRFPVVSVPSGAQSARKSIEENLEYLQGFKHVVLAFDSDDAGINAAKDCVELFEPGKVKLARWHEKDPNEMLLKGKASEITQCLFNAVEIRPDKICTATDLLDRITQRPEIGVAWPWQDLTECTLGMREQQLIVVGAAPGVGKTSMVKDIVLNMVLHKEQKVGIFSFEQDAADTIRQLIGGMIGKPLHIPGKWWDENVITKMAQKLDRKVFVYDNWGGAKLEDITPKMRYLAKASGVKLFVIDHLTALAAKMDGDERRGIEKAMEMLASLSRELRCSIVLVSHLARDKKVGADKDSSWGSGRRPVLENFKGSGAIEAWADVVLGLSRNADSEDHIEKQILKVECLKARLNGTKRGYSFKLKYNDAEGRYEDFRSDKCQENSTTNIV